jgi:predicted flap endonuclease-1-like 5' DNA nuclease
VDLLLTAVVAVLAGLLLGWALWRWRKGPGGRARLLRAELDRTTTSLGARTADLRTATEDLAEARRATDTVAAELARTAEERRGLEVELRAARTRLAAADATVESLRARLAEARSAHGSAVAAHRAALGERDAAIAEMTGLRAAHDELRATVARLEREHACARAARCAAVHQRDEALAAHAAAVGELASLEERVRTYRAERDAAESRRRDLEQQVAAHRSAAIEADARIVAAETEASRVTLEYAGLLMEREALAGDCDELERRLEALQVIDLRDPAGEGTAQPAPSPPVPLQRAPVPDGDDLKAIPGIGPVTEAMLRTQGIRTYAGLAALDDAALDRLAEVVSVLADHGRRTAWVTEAARLASVLVARRS